MFVTIVILQPCLINQLLPRKILEFWDILHDKSAKIQQFSCEIRKFCFVCLLLYVLIPITTMNRCIILLTQTVNTYTTQCKLLFIEEKSNYSI